jgi:hypothetical protein
MTVRDRIRESLLKGKAQGSTDDLLVLTSLDQVLLTVQTLFALSQNTLPFMRRSTVLSLPLQLVFNGLDMCTSLDIFAKILKQGTLTETGKLSTVDLLIRVACFVKKVNNV